MTYQTVITILLVFNILLAVDAWWLAKQCNKAERKVKELDDELARSKFDMPVAKIKADFSEEDIMKLKELLAKEPPKLDLANQEVKCDHLYGSVIIDQDVKHCCERMIFHCEYCNHEEIIPIKRGLLTNTLIRGGF